jgi:hypothetical protein
VASRAARTDAEEFQAAVRTPLPDESARTRAQLLRAAIQTPLPVDPVAEVAVEQGRTAQEEVDRAVIDLTDDFQQPQTAQPPAGDPTQQQIAQEVTAAHVAVDVSERAQRAEAAAEDPQRSALAPEDPVTRRMLGKRTVFQKPPIHLRREDRHKHKKQGLNPLESPTASQQAEIGGDAGDVADTGTSRKRQAVVRRYVMDYASGDEDDEAESRPRKRR